MSSTDSQEPPEDAGLQEARERVQLLTVIGLRDNLSPQQRENVKILERSARAEVKLRRRVLAAAEQEPKSPPEPTSDSDQPTPAS